MLQVNWLLDSVKAPRLDVVEINRRFDGNAVASWTPVAAAGPAFERTTLYVKLVRGLAVAAVDVSTANSKSATLVVPGNSTGATSSRRSSISAVITTVVELVKVRSRL